MFYKLMKRQDMDVKFTTEQISPEQEEEVIVKCYEVNAVWVENVRKTLVAQKEVGGYRNGAFFRLKLSDIYYFEVVEGKSFLYGQKEIFTTHEKLYEFEALSEDTSFFRCSKSMVLNADKIDYIRPSISGRFEAVLSNGETVIVSRKYVADLKQILGM